MNAVIKHLESALEAAQEQEAYILELHSELASLRDGKRPDFPGGAFVERLEFALRRWGGFKVEFTRLMKKAGVPGTSYRSLANYTEGITRPHREWMATAAEILDVDYEWLAAGR